MKRLISIIVPFYNSESTLKNCIESILKQTINNFELILIDNNSSDHSTNIALSYSKKFDFIYYYNINEKNVSKARNIGLSRAKGNYICFVDSDDIIDVNYLKILYENIKRHDMSICSFTRKKFLLNSKIKKNTKITKTQIYNYILKNRRISGYVWNKCFKKNIIDKYKIKFNTKLKIGEDIDFVFEYIKHCKRINFIDANLYYYSLNKNGAVCNKENYKYALNSWENMYKKYKSLNYDEKNLNLIAYFYFKKFYETKYFEKTIKLNNEIILLNNKNINYMIRLFLYKNFTFVIIILKKARNIL